MLFCRRKLKICATKEVIFLGDMNRNTRVIIVDDDMYARNWMAFLLTRDLRTQVVATVSGPRKAKTALHTMHPLEPIDIVIIDTEFPDEREWAFQIAKLFHSKQRQPYIIYTGTRVDRQLLPTIINKPVCRGYLLKQEISYALAAAISQVMAGHWVTTPSVQQTTHQQKLTLPPKTIVLQGQEQTLLETLTTSELAVFQLAILFNLTSKEIADELKLGKGYVNQLISRAYNKVGVRDLIQGDIPVEAMFQQQQLQQLVQQMSLPERQKLVEMTTWAFHILTEPDHI